MFGFFEKVSESTQIYALEAEIVVLTHKLERAEKDCQAQLKRALSAEQAIKNMLVNLQSDLKQHDHDHSTMIAHRINY